MVDSRRHRMRAGRFVTFVTGTALGVQFLTGCLETRTAVKEHQEKQVLRKQVANLQQTTADVNSRFMDIEDELRRVNGRLEVMENRLQQATAKMDASGGGLEARLKEKDEAYREEFMRLQSEIEKLKAQLSGLQDERKRAAAPPVKDPFQSAEENFSQKNFKDAILDYEKYRKTYPKGKKFGEATYKIGASFQELGLLDDAKAFYEEVVAKFPKSDDARRARAKLNAMKKK